MRGLYAILDVGPDGRAQGGLSPERWLRGLADAVAGGLDLGAVQLRAKHLPVEAAWSLLQGLRDELPAQVPWVLNDADPASASEALEAGVGLHLGQEDLARLGGPAAVAQLARVAQGAPIGVSTHTAAQARLAARLSVTYVAVGPVFSTRSKANPEPSLGLSGLLDACRQCSRDVVAIGGMDARRAEQAARMGAASVAVIGELAQDSEAAVTAAALGVGAAIARGSAPLSLDRVCEVVPVLERDLLEQLARWSDALSLHVAMSLPARFRPWVAEGEVWYRPCDVVDLLYGLDKQPQESWQQWSARTRPSSDPQGLVSLRRQLF